MRLLASDVARILGAPLIGDDATITSCSFDSRTVTTDEMFVAIDAERDGHDFVHDAVSRGANVVLVQRRLEGVNVTQIVVENTVSALGVLAAYQREQFETQLGGRVIAVTGSVGKTSTKDMIVSALSSVNAVQPVVASAKSLNNDIGLPITILNAVPDVRTFVLEMGMRGFGEIARLCDVAKPVIGVITAVGDAHSERVGGIDGVAMAKSELVHALPSDGTAVLNFDDTRVRAMADLTSARVVSYGQSTDADVCFEIFSVDAMYATIIVEHKGETAKLAVRWPGVHMASNAAAACAVAIACGASLDEAVKGLEGLDGDAGRMRVVKGINNLTIVDDSYNANPSSVAAALETVATSGKQTKVALLGVMAEVADEANAHRRIARLAASMGIHVVAVETHLYGIPAVSITDAVDYVRCLEGEAIVLVKGSRVAGLERIVDQIIAA